MRYVAVGELVDSAGVRRSAPRHGEERGLLPGARREGGRRVRPAAALRRVALIGMAQRAGFPLAEIARLLARRHHATCQWREMATRALPVLDRHIAQTQAPRPAVADCLERGRRRLDPCTSHDTPDPTP
ncbi:MerR family DNA-binding protein [Streptomyces sp. NPDC057702]|uniref:MerR family DNA-binding protein n=1 Tax=unclassified Streptomyces TaxID=2593676 RepID=UPI0036C9019E